MKFLAIKSLRISLKLNISAAREQQAVGLGLLDYLLYSGARPKHAK